MRAGAKFIINNNFKSTQLSQNKAKNKKKQQINIHSIISSSMAAFQLKHKQNILDILHRQRMVDHFHNEHKSARTLQNIRGFL